MYAEDRSQIASENPESLPDELSDIYVVGRDTVEGGALMGTYYRTEFWESRLEPFFVIEKSVPRGVFGHQSFSIVRKRPGAPDRSEFDRRYLASLERELYELRKRTDIVF